jgi:hypothetical protein
MRQNLIEQRKRQLRMRLSVGRMRGRRKKQGRQNSGDRRRLRERGKKRRQQNSSDRRRLRERGKKRRRQRKPRPRQSGIKKL